MPDFCKTNADYYYKTAADAASWRRNVNRILKILKQNTKQNSSERELYVHSQQ